MKHDSSTISWNKIGHEWCNHAQNNDFRMHYIMPYTLQKLGNVVGKSVLDLGCGEGGYSRELANRQAIVTAVDCNKFFIEYCIDCAKSDGLNIKHLVCNSNNLCDIDCESFDIVLCSMMLMDSEDLEGTLKEIYRVLKKDGILFASILHPCFTGKNVHSEKYDNETKRRVIIDDYFSPSEWEESLSNSFSNTVIWRHRTLSEYIKSIIKCGLTILDLNEPVPAKEQAEYSNRIAWLTKIPMVLFIEAQK